MMNSSKPMWGVEQYHELMDVQRDPRVDEWMGMSSVWPSVVLCVLYYLIVRVFGPSFMENREPYDVKTPMLLYNIFQTCFNFWICQGAARHWFAGNWVCQTVDYTYDTKAISALSISWWFFVSKFPDFLDSIFFLLRKNFRQLSSLHVIHHGTIPAFTWFAVKFAGGGNFLFSVMLNSAIHTIMYTYYFLAACGPKVRPYLWWKKYLTSLQLVQFSLIFLNCILKFTSGCEFSLGITLLLMYNGLLYFILFTNFYIQSYTKQKNVKGE